MKADIAGRGRRRETAFLYIRAYRKGSKMGSNVRDTLFLIPTPRPLHCEPWPWLWPRERASVYLAPLVPDSAGEGGGGGGMKRVRFWCLGGEGGEGRKETHRRAHTNLGGSVQSGRRWLGCRQGLR